ncbi:hypothetical protein CYMTET_36848 [Cymbomonas tetramitiformis]|uniref:Histidine phosphatase family protein n=1 Tax=Cymbomonas tetramitiformis TaxID=36881 RepID=A0AAE0F785_9CHLO|nr:hypothetical protein CYMTET_36848 [Cymbomonas tetramitiformis]
MTHASRFRTSNNISARKIDDKDIHFIRHGVTEMNVYLGRYDYDAADFIDPLMYDTRLTSEGEDMARKLNVKLHSLQPVPELLVASPLSRALRTADLAFEGIAVPREITPLAAERVWHASDIGRDPNQLAHEFDLWNFEELESVWWYSQSGHPQAVDEESPGSFHKRMEALREWLGRYPSSFVPKLAHILFAHTMCT